MSFDQHQRGTFGTLADVLIPAADGMPSASQADVSGAWLDAVLASRPELAEGLQALLETAAGRPADEVVEQLRQHDPDTFGLLAEVATNAYFMNPSVRDAIGYAGQPGREIDPRPDYMEDGLLESVIRRGPVFRPTPDNRDETE